MMCPSDTYNRENYSGRPSSDQNSNHGPNWGRGNYGANGGLGFQSDSAHCSGYRVTDVGCSAFDSPGWNDPRIRGVMGANTQLELDHIKDGTSTTIMLVEIRAGVTSFDPRGRVGAARRQHQQCLGRSATWATPTGRTGRPSGPMIPPPAAKSPPRSVGRRHCKKWAWAAIPAPAAPPTGRAPRAACTWAASFAVFADGSVHWIGDFIEVSNSFTHSSTWDRLMLSKDGLRDLRGILVGGGNCGGSIDAIHAA